MRLAVLLVFCFLFNFGCQEKTQRLVAEEKPASLATPEENSEIQSVIDEIQTYATQLKINKPFNKFQILVVDKFPNSGHGVAYCSVSSLEGESYIGILKSTMRSYLDNYKPRSGNSFLYKVLLHEFGHCLFDRAHDDLHFGISGSEIYFQASDSSPQYYKVGPSVAVSAMATGEFGQWEIFLPIGVRKYYLAELANEQKWNSRESLENTAGVQVIP